MNVKDWPVIKAAKVAAKHQLKFYDEMMQGKTMKELKLEVTARVTFDINLNVRNTAVSLDDLVESAERNLNSAVKAFETLGGKLIGKPVPKFEMGFVNTEPGSDFQKITRLT